MKKIAILFFLSFLFSPFNASALDYTLLEPIAGFLPTQAPQSLEVYLVGLFRLTIAVAGLLAVIRITWCGFNLMMSVNPSAREEAKKCIKMAIFGLLLALGSFLIVNSIRVGSAGGIGVQNPFTLPSLGSILNWGNGGGNSTGGGTVNPGSPQCTPLSSSVILYEGQTTNISVSCRPLATSYVWTSSNGAPVISDTGGAVSFHVAGDYTYRVVGTNAAGTGMQSQSLTIRVIARGTVACSQDMPQDVVGAISCEQANTVLNWNNLGSGERSAPVVLAGTESLSVLFTTAGVGSYGSAVTSAIMTSRTMTVPRIVDPLADPPVIEQEEIVVSVPANTNAIKYMNISRAMCDFRYENLTRGTCAAYGDDVSLRFQVGGGTPPSNAGPGCILLPNTAYVINVRNENPTIPGLNTCPPSEICEFNFAMEQSAGAQFTPQETVACTVPDVSQASGPLFSFTNLLNNANVAPGDLSIAFAASDSSEISTIEFAVYNLETGALVDRRLACAFNNQISADMLLCGNSISDTITLTVGPGEGSYRIVAQACSGGSCTTQTRTVIVQNACVRGQTGLTCFDLPTAPVTAGDMCAPQYGFANTVADDQLHGYRFRLAPGEYARLVIANRPSDSCALPPTPPPPPPPPPGTSSPNGIKWHPGVYIGFSTMKCDAGALAEYNSMIDSISNDTLIEGVHIRMPWSCYEGNTAGDYSGGFAIVDALLARLGNLAVPKRLMLEVLQYSYGSCSQGQDGNIPATGSILLPTYVINTPGWVEWCYDAGAGPRRYVTALWNAGVNDRLIALSSAYGARYNSHPLVEAFRLTEETAVLTGTSLTGYSVSASLTQWQRMINAMFTHWPNTLVRNPINFVGNDSQTRSLFDSSLRPGVLFGGPDAPPFPETAPRRVRNVQGNRLYVGQNNDGTTHAGWANLRDTYPMAVEIQGGTPIYGDLTLQELYSGSYSDFHPEYIIWLANTWDGETHRYTTPMLQFVRGGNSPVYSTACPTGWTCNTN